MQQISPFVLIERWRPDFGARGTKTEFIGQYAPTKYWSLSAWWLVGAGQVWSLVLEVRDGSGLGDRERIWEERFFDLNICVDAWEDVLVVVGVPSAASGPLLSKMACAQIHSIIDAHAKRDEANCWHS